MSASEFVPRTLGIVGGMGPAASTDFMSRIIDLTPAVRDQDHIPVVLVSDPRIPDRATALATRCEERVFAALAQRVGILNSLAVDAIAVPCNTADYWLPRIAASSEAPIISMIDSCVESIAHDHPDAATALVLGTRGTVSMRLYDERLVEIGISPVAVKPDEQGEVDLIIAQVKAGKVTLAQAAATASLPRWLDRADLVVLACTELPLALPTTGAFKRVINPAAALAKYCVEWATGAREARFV